MAKLWSKSQPIRAGVLNPMANYSRIVTCSHYHPSPPGQDYAYTEALGQNLWLLGVDVWLTTIMPLADHQFVFSIWRMSQEPANRMAMYLTENILPVQSTTGIWYWHATGPDKQFHWSMHKLYKGVGQRFGVVLTGAPAVLSQIHASFEIAEG